jgi:hypothetical protein
MTIIRRLFSRRALAYATGSTALATGGFYWYLNSGPAYPSSTKQTRRPPPPWTPPSRAEMLAELRKSGEQAGEEFDLLVVGGGATGAGVAVDAASRGLKVALVERDDFGSGESSDFQLAIVSNHNKPFFKARRRNRQNSFMEVFGTFKRPYSSWITININLFARRSTNAGYSLRRLPIYPTCYRSCCLYTSTGKFLTIWLDASCTIYWRVKKIWRLRML